MVFEGFKVVSLGGWLGVGIVISVCLIRFFRNLILEFSRFGRVLLGCFGDCLELVIFFSIFFLVVMLSMGLI